MINQLKLYQGLVDHHHLHCLHRYEMTSLKICNVEKRIKLHAAESRNVTNSSYDEKSIVHTNQVLIFQDFYLRDFSVLSSSEIFKQPIRFLKNISDVTSRFCPGKTKHQVFCKVARQNPRLVYCRAKLNLHDGVLRKILIEKILIKNSFITWLSSNWIAHYQHYSRLTMPVMNFPMLDRVMEVAEDRLVGNTYSRWVQYPDNHDKRFPVSSSSCY